jgi:Xaa-Pro aminopeptidase
VTLGPVTPELEQKLQRIRSLLREEQLVAVRLRGVDWFAWATCGGSSRILLSAETGVADVLVTSDDAFVFTDVIEAERLAAEELPSGWTVVAHAWERPEVRERQVQERAGSGAIASDRPVGDERPLPASFARGRWALVLEEQQRLRALGSDTAVTLTDALSAAEPTWSGHRLSASVHAGLVELGIDPILVLVGDAERLGRWRHPTASDRLLGKRAMVVVCARRHGLYACCTRLVAFGPPTTRALAADAAVLEVEAAALDASRPGVTLGTVLEQIQAAYARAGTPEAWREHHQGGPTGYLARERVALPGDAAVLPRGAAVAWNPSLPGAKSEDTVLLAPDGGQDVVTFDPRWPSTIVAGRARPAVWVR